MITPLNHPPKPTPPPDLAVVIVNYNGWPDVVGLVAALAAEPEVAAGRCEVVVVDNASEGPLPAFFRTPSPGVRLVLRAENGGFAAGVNAGWRATRAPWILLLNPDVQVASGFIGPILDRVEGYWARPGGPPAVVGFGLRNADGSRQPSVGVEPSLARSLWGQFIPRSRRKYQADRKIRAGPVPWVTGACALVHAAVLDALDGMDENYFLYYEEVALCREARRMGRAVEYDPTIEVVHLRPLQDRPISPLMRTVTRHSKLLYFRDHRPAWEFRALTWAISVEAWGRGLLASGKGQDEAARAWRVIGRVAKAMRRGKRISGREARKLAMAAISRGISGPRLRKAPAERRSSSGGARRQS